MSDMWVDERGSEVLGLAECRRLLAVGAKERRHGHVGVPKDGAPLVVPVNYTVEGPDVVVRVGEGLFGRLVGRLVAFQVDGTEGLRQLESVNGRRRWSVLVRGLAIEEKLVSFEGELPVPEVAEPGGRVVRIRADVVTGRRLRKANGESRLRRPPSSVGSGSPVR